jgi:hypothetical protein
MDQNNRKQRERKTMLETTQSQAVRPQPPPMSRQQALVKLLTQETTIKAIAPKARRHQAWRDPDGKMLALSTVEREIRRLAEFSPLIQKRWATQMSHMPALLISRKTIGPHD